MIYIIRHGQTEMNQAFLMQGRINLPLNETGKEQALDAGRKLEALHISFDRIYSSPLIRAQQTAALVCGQWTGEAAEPEEIVTMCQNGNTPFFTEERLIEMDYGPYEGMSLKNPPPEVIAFFQDFQNVPAPEGMESLKEIVKRTGSFLEEIRALAEKENILISTHAIAMKGILEYLTPDSNGAYWSKTIRNCAVYTAKIENGAYTVPTELVLE